jgi:hypothetical protein
VAVEESVYDAVELDFLSDDCEFCRMMKVRTSHRAGARGRGDLSKGEQGGGENGA